MRIAETTVRGGASVPPAAQEEAPLAGDVAPTKKEQRDGGAVLQADR